MNCPACSSPLLPASENSETAACPCGWSGYLDSLTPPHSCGDHLMTIRTSDTSYCGYCKKVFILKNGVYVRKEKQA
jgi:hypothetical protein